MSRGFRTFDHTADIGLEVWGENFNSVFEEAGVALFSLISDLSLVEPQQEFSVNLTASGGEALFLAWLKELLFLFETKHVLFSKFHINELSFNHLNASVFGEALNETKHKLGREVKAVTHHQFEFIKRPHGFLAKVILDI